MRERLFLVASCCLVLAGCRELAPPGDRAHAVAITDPSQLIGGLKASGQLGDLLLSNTKVRFIIAAGGPGRSWFPGKGQLLDADRVRAAGDPGDDRLQELVTRLGTLGVMYSDDVKVLSDGADGSDAVVRVSGHDVHIPVQQEVIPLPSSKVDAVTEYRLAPYAESLELTTTITNRSGARQQVQVGDVAALVDYLTPYAPGYGAGLESLSFAPSARFFAAFGGKVSYGYLAPGRTLGVLAPQGEVLPLATDRLTLEPGDSARFTRYLAVGEGDVTSLLPEVLRREGGDPTRLVSLRGTVTEAKTGRVVAGARVAFGDPKGPYAVAVSDAQGHYLATLERQRYTATASADGREGIAASIDLSAVAEAASPSLDLQVKDTGRVELQVNDLAGAPCPARVQLFAGDGTRAGVYLSADGRGGVSLPPGSWRAVFSRGYEWGAAERSFTVTAGQTTALTATLTRVVDTTGYLAIDSHTHTSVSIDSTLPAEERVAQALADGVELVITTEHDVAFDLGPTVAELGAGADLATQIGAEISPAAGHINGYPITVDQAAGTAGAWPIVWWTEDLRHDYLDVLWPKAIFAALRQDLSAQVVQLNHPRSKDQGLLEWVGYDPLAGLGALSADRFDMGWDVLEVCNDGCRADPDSTDGRTLKDYFSFLNQGFVRGAVGVSDAHSSDRMLGRARTMVQVLDDDPAHLDPSQVWDSLKAGRAVVVDGPFVEATIDEGGQPRGVGALAKIAGAQLSLHVRVQAPPWIPTDRITVISNGQQAHSIVLPASTATVRFDADIVLPAPAQDAWYVIVVDGDRDMAPVLPGAKPRSLTNALFVDRNGNGVFDAPGL